MNEIIIVGAGKIGIFLANKLSENHNVTLIDKSVSVNGVLKKDVHVYDFDGVKYSTQLNEERNIIEPSDKYLESLSSLLNIDKSLFKQLYKDFTLDNPLNITSEGNNPLNLSLSQSFSNTFNAPLIIEGESKVTGVKTEISAIQARNPGLNERVKFIDNAYCISVMKEVIDCKNRKVRGVLYLKNKMIHEIVANDVILCCGVVDTPLILQRSNLNIGERRDGPISKHIGQHMINQIGERYNISFPGLFFPPEPVNISGVISLSEQVRDISFSLTLEENLLLEYKFLNRLREGYVETNGFLHPTVHVNSIFDEQYKNRFLMLMESTITSFFQVNNGVNPTFTKTSHVISNGVGTCSIGKVVDSNFKVIQFENLFVCDASVLPIHPDGSLDYFTPFLAYVFSEIYLEEDIKEECSF